jgi:hypothetical protein
MIQGDAMPTAAAQHQYRAARRPFMAAADITAHGRARIQARA